MYLQKAVHARGIADMRTHQVIKEF